MNERNISLPGEGREWEIKECIRGLRLKAHFGNGHFFRDFYEDSLRKQFVRLQAKEHLILEDLKTTFEQDIKDLEE